MSTPKGTTVHNEILPRHEFITEFAALGAAVVFNAGKVQPLVREVRLAWVQVINAVSGVNRGV